MSLAPGRRYGAAPSRRHANHFEAAFDGDLLLVTEHGWPDFMTKEAGSAPAMHPRLAG